MKLMIIFFAVFAMTLAKPQWGFEAMAVDLVSSRKWEGYGGGFDQMQQQQQEFSGGYGGGFGGQQQQQQEGFGVDLAVALAAVMDGRASIPLLKCSFSKTSALAD
ncbi:uncharacterized protein LOC6649928 [Drosophila willistoni]|uniref:uncharacterized protein LOC6649928 n=1 Tax=Drosophila willistoni TaxID=7260 RepID=UPI001F076D16|nr:uncharacterized protein LOC6649928 [Drosophila willistoni]